MTNKPSLYLVNPASTFPTYYSVEALRAGGYSPAALVADLAVVTIAGMAPSDFNVALVDENISPVDFDISADFVGITGKVNQWRRMAEIAREFRRRGKTVIMGGPFASLSPDVVRPYCDILVKGEIEEVSDTLFTNLRSGNWKKEYAGQRSQFSSPVMPRWDLYPNDRALLGIVQTSRGCPFQCEFCDTIQYVGRQQRHKPVQQILNELDDLYKYGYRMVFFADDNFTANRQHAKELLRELRNWNLRQKDGPVSFVTQVSIDSAADEELLRMCAEAGMIYVFIGIETPNEDSLRQSGKNQNLRDSLTGQIERFLHNGIGVMAGMIVGFDSDGQDIFARQYEFAQSVPIPIFSLGALVAPAGTQLYERLAADSRILPGEAGIATMAPWDTNIVPNRMKREELLSGIKALCARLYDPGAFTDRLMRFIEKAAVPDSMKESGTLGQLRGRSVEIDTMRLMSDLKRLGPEEAAMWSQVRAALSQKPKLALVVLNMLLQYMQIRYMYNSK
ncbi:MAG: radical SAM protein [Nitrospirae bacterium]|nr:radical SAM protein [Nitrospirota bacterium]